jgi:hypothetical protein
MPAMTSTREADGGCVPTCNLCRATFLLALSFNSKKDGEDGKRQETSDPPTAEEVAQRRDSH